MTPTSGIPATATPRVRAVAIATVVIVIALVGLHESAGFTRDVLFFDDAWAALPAHQTWTTAVRMSVSTPGWTLFMWAWIRAGTYASWWAQVPALAFAVLAGLGVFGLLRRLGHGWAVCVAATAILVTNPTTITYATRVKPYTLEMLLAVGILALGESVRRSPSPRRYGVLALASLATFLVSFATFAVVVAVWVAALVWARGDRAGQRRWLTFAVPTAAVGALAGLPLALLRPGLLGENWKRHGFMARYDGLRPAAHNLALMFGGLLHGLTNAPVASTFPLGAAGTATTLSAIACVLALVAMVVMTLRPTALAKRPELAPASISLLIAVVLALVDAFPLGDGRTDEVLYPGAVLLLASLLGALARRFARRSAALGTVAVLVLGGTLSGFSVAANAAQYPQANLVGLYDELKADLLPGDVVVIPAYLSFSWADAGLSKYRIVLDPHPAWPQGFRVASSVPIIVLPSAYVGADAELDHLAPTYKRVWYIGYDLGVWNPYAVSPSFPAGIPMATYTFTQLTREGWKNQFFPLRALNCYAQPLSQHPVPVTGAVG